MRCGIAVAGPMADSLSFLMRVVQAHGPCALSARTSLFRCCGPARSAASHSASPPAAPAALPHRRRRLPCAEFVAAVAFVVIHCVGLCRSD